MFVDVVWSGRFVLIRVLHKPGDDTCGYDKVIDCRGL